MVNSGLDTVGISQCKGTLLWLLVFWGCVFVTEVYQKLRKFEDSVADMTGRTELKAMTPVIGNNLYKPNYFHTDA